MKIKSRQTLKGLNLGGWLVVEKWMTPSLFEGMTAKNEFELSRSDLGRKRIIDHRKTFIGLEDLDWLVLQKIDIVRVPLGYWAVSDASPYISARDSLDWLMDETRKRGLKVLLDLHAAPGAQNSKDHSGSGNQIGHEFWPSNKRAQNDTIETLEHIANRYGQYDNLWGLQLLNEPTIDAAGWRLVSFYRRAYRSLSALLPKSVYIIFSDGYAPAWLTGTLSWPLRRNNPVAMDSHFYQCFGAKDKARKFDGHLGLARRRRRTIALLSFFQPMIVGEWSTVLPYGLTDEQNILYYKTQEISQQGAVANFYWSYKTEGTSGWNYRWMVDNNKF